MPEGRARNRLDLTLSREEWTELKAEIRKQDYGIPYTFCDELICECRDQPPEYLARFGNPNITPCQAGKVFGVILECPRCFSAVEDSRAAGRKTDHVEIESPCPRRDKNRHFRFRNRK